MFRFLSNVSSRIVSSYTASYQLPKVSLIPHIDAAKLLGPQQDLITNQVRYVTKFSKQKGKRKSVLAVPRRFLRLHWGGWIRTKAGRHRKLWSKSISNRRQLREHVLCNATQCTLLDKMVSAFWRKPKYYINDPYAVYHQREEFWITRRKPWRPEGWE